MARDEQHILAAAHYIDTEGGIEWAWLRLASNTLQCTIKDKPSGHT